MPRGSAADSTDWHIKQGTLPLKPFSHHSSTRTGTLYAAFTVSDSLLVVMHTSVLTLSFLLYDYYCTVLPLKLISASDAISFFTNE